MSWVYDLFDCLRYEYPNESHGPERPSDPPIPPAGWPLPRVGEVLPVDQNDDRYTPFKAKVIGVEWDYAVPRVTIQLEVVREQNTMTTTDDYMGVKPELIEKACETYRRPNRMLTNDSATRHHDCMAAALEAVADDLRAEGVVKALRSAIEELERMDDGRTTAYHSAGRHIIARLRARAELIEAGSGDE